MKTSLNAYRVSATWLSLILALPVFGQEQVVKIGHVAPLSGAQAHYGKDNENGARMAIEELNTQGITIGGKKIKFELQAEDDAADPKQGTAAAQKLCDAKVAGVVGHLNSGTTIPASKVYNDCGIPHVTGAATNPNLTKPGYKTTFRIIANDNALGAGLAAYAVDTLKLKTVAIIDDRTAYGQGVADVFKKAASAKGIKVVDEQFTTDKATDFMAILTSIKSKNPDAIFYGGMDPQGGPMLRQMEQLGMGNVKYFGGDGICTPEIAKLAAGAKTLANVICAEGGASLAKMRGGTAWKAKYDAKYPNQFQVYSPYTYDATFLIVDAMKRANSVDPKVYTPELLKSNFKGVTSTIAFESNGEPKSPPVTIYSYKDGKKVALSKNRRVTTFFATDRTIKIAEQSLDDKFSSERGELTYGVAEVNIPQNHHIGEIERPPAWLSFFVGEDIDKHVVLTSATILNANKYYELIKGALNKDAKRAFIFIHGYNVSFHDAALRTAQMAVDLDLKTVPVFYSWPSRGHFEDYTKDNTTAQWTEKNLSDFLESFAKNSDANEIFIIAHSMGTHPTTKALANVMERDRNLAGRFKELVLAAPDIDTDIFMQQILPRFSSVPIPITLYASSKDRALLASVKVNGETRAGLAGKKMVIANRIETIDASEIDTDFLGHSYYGDSRILLTDIALIIGSSMRAKTRPLLESRPEKTPSHWAFRK